MEFLSNLDALYFVKYLLTHSHQEDFPLLFRHCFHGIFVSQLQIVKIQLVFRC